ncbi:MAG: cyclase family protein [Clostridia bacterium]|nr:cyclase family protein [Clostridia bacterium]
MHLIDITRDITTAEIYPGDPPTLVRRVKSIGDESDYNLSVLCTCVHAGTHADAPLHFIEDGCSAEQLPAEAFIGPCTVLEIKDSPITGECVNRRFPQNVERLLIKGSGEVTFMDSAAFEAAELPLRLIGTDALSVGSQGSELQTHKAFLQKGIVILEGLDLSAVEPGNYFLIALPMKIGGADGAPVRAFLADDYIFWTQKK